MGSNSNIECRGRSVASNGYMLLRVGRDHHLADVRGYAYEHRVVAERLIGRRLLPGEQVHHINRDKLDNRPENLEVTASIRHHRVRHRTANGRRLQLPGEPNSTITCACGCGEQFMKYDTTGRPRRFVTGHNPNDSPVADAILSVLKGGPRHRDIIAEQLNSTIKRVATILSRMKRQKLIIQRGGGFWSLPGRELDGRTWDQLPERKVVV